jgi:hypothetical protein
VRVPMEPSRSSSYRGKQVSEYTGCQAFIYDKTKHHWHACSGQSGHSGAVHTCWACSKPFSSEVRISLTHSELIEMAREYAADTDDYAASVLFNQLADALETADPQKEAK